jgi:hypothetical protein
MIAPGLSALALRRVDTALGLTKIGPAPVSFGKATTAVSVRPGAQPGLVYDV